MRTRRVEIANIFFEDPWSCRSFRVICEGCLAYLREKSYFKHLSDGHDINCSKQENATIVSLVIVECPNRRTNGMATYFVTVFAFNAAPKVRAALNTSDFATVKWDAIDGAY